MPIRLKPCPETPNCVCTYSDDPRHAMQPIVYRGTRDDATVELKHIIMSLPRTRLIEETDTYLHFTFTSRIFRFVDDVEFEVDESANVIHYRSASRVGRSDLGVNRKRMQKIVEAFSG